MHFLLLCILSSTGIFIIFKSIDQYGIPAFPVILINYLAAAGLGFLISRSSPLSAFQSDPEWLPLGVIIGILFILMFFLVGYSSRKAGISVTTVASKMSVVFPILFSLIIDAGDRLTPVKGTAILCTLSGVALTVFRPRRAVLDPKVIYIPLLLFTGMGLVDSLVKYAQHHYVGDASTALFSAVVFLNALASGILVLLFLRGTLRWFTVPSVWGWGFLLGAVNYGSIYFLVRALNYRSPAGPGMDSSLIFGVNNIGIVALSVLAGILVFREKLLPLNWAGILLSAFAILLFAIGK